MSESDEIYKLVAKIARPVSSDVMSPDIHHFPLSKAYLCQDCENVSNSPSKCPSCTGANMLLMAPFFTHTQEERQDKQIVWPDLLPENM